MFTDNIFLQDMDLHNSWCGFLEKFNRIVPPRTHDYDLPGKTDRVIHVTGILI